MATGSASIRVDEAALMTEHRALVAEGQTQFDFQMRTPPKVPEWLQGLADWVRAHPQALKYGLYAVLALGALLILWQLARAVRPWLARAPAPVLAADPGWQPEAAGARRLLAEADALAAAGDHAEAVHLLLLRSVEAIDARHPGALRPGWTSRDIAALPLLSARSAAAFAGIAATVETGLFARRPVGEGDWQRCRRAYQDAAFGAAA